jgi:hypothetical protein
MGKGGGAHVCVSEGGGQQRDKDVPLVAGVQSTCTLDGA